MRSKSLRELQQHGERALADRHPLLLTSRNGPVGILLPVTDANVSYVQAEVERIVANESLRRTWELARETGLDRLTPDEIDAEVKQHRKGQRRVKRARS